MSVLQREKRDGWCKRNQLVEEMNMAYAENRQLTGLAHEFDR
jgi:hypothetical protein